MTTSIAQLLLAASNGTPAVVAPWPRIEVRWRSHRTAWTPRLDAGMAVGGHRRVDFVLRLEVERPSRAVVEAWLEAADRRPVLEPQRLACLLGHGEGLVHIDVRSGARRVLSLSLSCGHDRVVYAQSDLLAEAGLAGGSYDPPSVRSVAARPEVASA